MPLPHSSPQHSHPQIFLSSLSIYTLPTQRKVHLFQCPHMETSDTHISPTHTLTLLSRCLTDHRSRLTGRFYSGGPCFPARSQHNTPPPPSSSSKTDHHHHSERSEGEEREGLERRERERSLRERRSAEVGSRPTLGEPATGRQGYRRRRRRSQRQW
ncbi:hypothetical protein HanPI659440_Chr07g0255391 [Helianthus annuus]|nr:hypothetical protein HanPI659440_Chr07g0255391 [Helianthus annuus]